MITSKVLCTFHLLRVVPDCAAKDTSGIVLQIMRVAEYLSLMTIVGGVCSIRISDDTWRTNGWYVGNKHRHVQIYAAVG